MRGIEFYNLDKDKIVDEIRSLEPIKLAFHSDADGLASACLIASVFKVREDSDYPFSPEIFGDYMDSNLAVDLGSPIDHYDGIVIDHHPDHPDNPDYKLVLGNVPTGVVIFELFKDLIPDDKIWLVCLSACGDGQPEVIPEEVWIRSPYLWEMQGKIYRDQYRRVRTYPYPIFSKISSPINSMCRMGDVMGAYKLLRSAKSVRDVINNPVAIRAVKKIDEEVKRIFSTSDPPIIEQVKHVAIVQIESEYSIAGRIATELYNSEPYLTFVVINTKHREVSVRGILTKYITDRLSEKGYIAGGHAGYGGVSLLDEDHQPLEVFLNHLREIARTPF